MNIENIVKELKSSLKMKSIISGGDYKDPSELIPTGNLALDFCLDGGFCFKFIAQLLGKSKSGKTALMLKTAANAQRKYGAIVIWADREGAFVTSFAKKLGLDLNMCLLVQPQDIPTPKEVFEFLAAAHNSFRRNNKEAYIVMCIDSIAAFLPAASSSGEDMGKVAKGLHRGFRAIIEKIDKRTILLFSNQIQARVGVLFGKKETAAGGFAPEYYSSYILELDEGKKIKDNNEVIGSFIEAEVIKTRLGPAYRGCIIPFYFDKGFTKYGGFFRMLAIRGIVEPTNKSDFKKGLPTFYKYKDKKYKEDEGERFLKENPDFKLD